MELGSANSSADVQSELRNVDSDHGSHNVTDDVECSTKLLGEIPTELSPALPIKLKKKFRRRPRKHKPGNRKRQSHKLRNRKRFTPRRRQIIPRSSLGAPFLCNDMLMAKDGFVFDTCSGKIEFKPEVVRGHSENPPVGDQRGRQSRYVPLSPDHEQQNLMLDCNENLSYSVVNIDDEICLDLNNNQEILSLSPDSAYASPSLPTGLESSDNESFGFEVDVNNQQDMSLYFDDEKNFQFHLRNFEEDTDRFLRSSLMELSRENLEAEYHSTMRRLRSLQSNKSILANECRATPEVKDFSNPLERTMSLTDQLKQLNQLATSVSIHLEKLQQDNNHLREENFQLQIALGNINI